MVAVGIDVSKSKSTVAILNSDGSTLVKPFDMKHNQPEVNLPSLSYIFKKSIMVGLLKLPFLE